MSGSEHSSRAAVSVDTTAEAVLAGVITTDDRAGNDLADAACKLVVLEHRAPSSARAAGRSANLAVTRMTHWIARVGSARQRLDTDMTWIPGRGRATTRLSERARPWPLPAIQRGVHTFVDSASGCVCSLCQHPERTTRGRCQSGRRSAANLA